MTIWNIGTFNEAFVTALALREADGLFLGLDSEAQVMNIVVAQYHKGELKNPKDVDTAVEAAIDSVLNG